MSKRRIRQVEANNTSRSLPPSINLSVSLITADQKRVLHLVLQAVVVVHGGHAPYRRTVVVEDQARCLHHNRTQQDTRNKTSMM